ncbi:hypothetical protein [Catenulispora rubra]|nr:hypothetical protein [Catenulispora rubra]
MRQAAPDRKRGVAVGVLDLVDRGFTTTVVEHGAAGGVDQEG